MYIGKAQILGLKYFFLTIYTMSNLLMNKYIEPEKGLANFKKSILGSSHIFLFGTMYYFFCKNTFVFFTRTFFPVGRFQESAGSTELLNLNRGDQMSL
jgi:hypothetical protein